MSLLARISWRGGFGGVVEGQHLTFQASLDVGCPDIGFKQTSKHTHLCYEKVICIQRRVG